MQLLTWRRTIDIYIAAVSHAHAVCAPNVYVAIVSTIVETSVPEREILPGLQLLGTIVDKYVLLFLVGTFGLHSRSQVHLHRQPLHTCLDRSRRQYLYHQELRRDDSL
jgi:hypothetical protein